jgi:hypothetical protein
MNLSTRSTLNFKGKEIRTFSSIDWSEVGDPISINTNVLTKLKMFAYPLRSAVRVKASIVFVQLDSVMAWKKRAVAELEKLENRVSNFRCSCRAESSDLES